MAIVRTVVAKCDELPFCPNGIELDPEGSQTFIELIARGWAVVNDLPNDTIRTYCPLHKDNHKES